MKYFNGERYRLDSFVLMPNHVHVLFQPERRYKLKAILHTWKSFSSKEIHRSTGQIGALWAEGYWDRLIRNQAHLDACRRYIRKKRGSVLVNTHFSPMNKWGAGHMWK
ncbi:MAG: transposase [Opitutales bacterium]